MPKAQEGGEHKRGASSPLIKGVPGLSPSPPSPHSTTEQLRSVLLCCCLLIIFAKGFDLECWA